MRHRTNALGSIISAILFVIVLMVFSFSFLVSYEDASYFCDVKVFSLNTCIYIQKDGETVYTVEGKKLRFLEDPLKLYKNGDLVNEMGDDYNLFSQDDHVLIVDGIETLVMEGQLNFFGDSYRISKINEDGSLTHLATAKFNLFNTKGTVMDVNGDVIAEFKSSLFRRDFAIYIYDNSNIDDEAFIMIFSSYYSDNSFDTSSSSSSSNNN